MFARQFYKLVPNLLPEIWKKKTISYLLKRYLGHFLSENVTLEQLTVDLGQGKGSIRDLNLDVEAISGLLEDVPVEIIDGFIQSIELAVPWASLLKESTTVDIHGLELTIRPKQVTGTAAFLDTMSMLNSMSMSSSLQLARECLESEKPPKPTESPTEEQSPFEGVQMFAQTIESVLSRVKVTLVNTVIRLEYVDPATGLGVGLELKIERMEYFDDQAVAEEQPASMTGDGQQGQDMDWQPAILIKNFHAMGTTITIDTFNHNMQGSMSAGPDSLGNSPNMYISTLSSLYASHHHPYRGEEGDGEGDMAGPAIHPIPIAVLVGKSMVKVKVKQKESLEGPKLGLDCQFGALHFLLSPQELHALLQLVSGFAQPTSGSSRSGKGRTTVNKPMDAADFERVEQELQRHLHAERLKRQGMDIRGYQEDPLVSVLGNMDDSEELYFSMTAPQTKRSSSVMESSMTSVNTVDSASTQATSTFPHSEMGSIPKATRQSQKRTDSGGRAMNDPSAEISHYYIKVGMVSVCLLHEDPKPDYTRGEKSSYTDRMKSLANEYFRNVRVINFVGHNLSLKDIRDKVSAALPLDHIGLLSKPLSLECVERTLRKNHSYSVDVTLQSAELVECLFDRREDDPSSVSFTADTDVKLPQYSELLTFPSQDSAEQTPHGSLYAVTPAARLRVSVISRIEPYGDTTSETKVAMELGPLSSEVDITIIDRLTGLLYPSTPQYAAAQSGVFAQTTGGNAGPHCFDQAMDDGSSAKDGAIDAVITCAQASLRIRFPVPDLHPSSQLAPRQWWRRDLHKEILLLELQHLRFHTGSTQSGISVFELTCSQVDAYFQEDFNQTPVLFGRVTGDDSVDAQEAEEGFNWPRVVVKTFPHSTGSLDPGEESDDSTPNSSLNGACEFSAPEPSPFSSKKSMYDRDDMFHMNSEDGTAPPDTQETVIPGDKRELQIFQEYASARTQLLVEITAPVVTALLHDKAFFEMLYNRVNNDLLMWEPQAPAPSFSPESIPSSLGVHLSVQHLLGGNASDHSELFDQQSSQFDSDSDSDDQAPYYSIHESRRHKDAPRRLQSKLCLSLSIGEGKLLACVPHKEEGCHGELFVVLKDALLYSVTAHGGDPELRYLCFQSNRASLYHGPCVRQPVIAGRLDGITDNTPTHLNHRIYRSERGVPTGSVGLVGTGADNSQDMISVAVKTKIDTMNNTKHFTVSLAVQGGTLRHEMSGEGESWISQIIELLDVKDFPIKGYTMPTVLTELHLHLKGCAVDYRPLHLPIRAVLTADNFSVSSNLTASSNSTSLRFLLEEAALFLSDKKYMEVNLKKDYVCVAHIAMFELCARLGDGKEPGWPKTDMRVLANKVELRTCADSCRALVDLIMYFSRDGDLDPRLAGASEDGESVSSQQSTPRHGSEERWRSEESLSESRLDYLHSMMEDAIRESSTSASDSDSPEKTQPGTAVFFMTEDHFKQSPQAAPPAGLRQIVVSPSSDSMTDSMLSQDADISDFEEDFCVIDNPGIGIAPRDGEPVIRVFTQEPITIIDDFLSKPLGKIDHLKAPPNYPKPDRRYTVRELTLTWYMYGGQDFGKDRGREPEKTKPEKAQTPKHSLPIFGSPSHSMEKQKRPRTWQEQGGPMRNHDILMEVCLCKIGLQFEEYPPSSDKAARFVGLVHDIAVLDRLKASHINKFLYQDISEKRPRQTSANMLCVKALLSRPDPKLPTRECSVHVSALPIRLNVDQESLFFLRQFAMEFMGQQPSDPYHPTPGGEGFRSATPTLSSSGGSASSRDRAPVLSLEIGPEEEERDEEGRPRPELLIQLDELSLERSQALKAALEEEGSDTSSNYDDSPIFFKSVVFSPAVPIRLDYSGKCLEMDRSLAGLLIGLAQLNNSELCLKRISHKQGLLGAEKVVAFLLNEWLTDIRANQLPMILGGVGPMHSFVQLAQGIRDMFWMPVEQYRRDGRVWRGMQRGASSLTMSTARAVLELTNKLVGTVQYVSEVTYDMLSPGPSVRQPRRHSKSRRRLPRRQPTDLREGVTNAYHVITEGISDTAQQLVRAATEEQEQKGMTGVVGGVLRQIPPTAVKPLIIASSATSNLLGGMRNQLCPAARKEDEDKWKGNE